MKRNFCNCVECHHIYSRRCRMKKCRCCGQGRRCNPAKAVVA